MCYRRYADEKRFERQRKWQRMNKISSLHLCSRDAPLDRGLNSGNGGYLGSRTAELTSNLVVSGNRARARIRANSSSDSSDVFSIVRPLEQERRYRKLFGTSVSLGAQDHVKRRAHPAKAQRPEDGFTFGTSVPS